MGESPQKASINYYFQRGMAQKVRLPSPMQYFKLAYGFQMDIVLQAALSLVYHTFSYHGYLGLYSQTPYTSSFFLLNLRLIFLFSFIYFAYLVILCRIVELCIKKRQQWKTCFARKVCKESDYYDEMMRYLRKNLAVRFVQSTENAYKYVLL